MVEIPVLHPCLHLGDTHADDFSNIRVDIRVSQTPVPAMVSTRDDNNLLMGGVLNSGSVSGR